MAVINGSADADYLNGTDVADTISGLDGDDYISAASGNDSVLGGNGSDIISLDYSSYDPTDGRDIARGGDGNDIITGLAGDSLYGDGDNDQMYVSDGYTSDEGRTLISGGTGDDRIETARLYQATILGGSGHDEIKLQAARGVIIDAGEQNDSIHGDIASGVASITGGAGNDTLSLLLTNTQPSSVSGGDGDDLLSVYGSQLTLDAGSGNDRINLGVELPNHYGAETSGTLSTGLGSDVIAVGNARNIVVSDFNTTEGGDRLDLTPLFASLNLRGWDSSNPFTSGWLRLRAVDGNTVLEMVENQPGAQAQWLNLLTLNGVNPASLNASHLLPGINPLGNTTPVVLTANPELDAQLFGQDGNDTLTGGNWGDLLDGGYGGADSLRGGGGADSIFGFSGNDSLYGDSGNDSVFGGGGDDYINGGDGDESVSPYYYDHWIYKGIAYTGGLQGGAGNDTIDGGAGSDLLDGGAGNDSLLGGLDNDTLYGGTGKDVLRGGAGDDLLLSETQSSDVGPDSGGDALFGDAGNDSLIYRGSKAGYLDGSIDNDSLYLAGGNNSTMLGGAGDDFLMFEAVLDGVVANAGDGNDSINAALHQQSNASISGGLGNDSLRVNTVNSTIQGGDGDDFIQLAGEGNIVDAGAGNDRVDMHGGAYSGVSRFHTVTLGTGMDTVQASYHSVAFGGVTPVITDFSAGAGGDVIDLSDVLNHLYSYGLPQDSDPFASGALRLTDAGEATVLEMRDTFGQENTYVGILRLENIANPASLVAANFQQGFTPVVSSNAAVPVAQTSKTIVIAEGGTANLGLTAPSDPDGGAVTIIVDQAPWYEYGTIYLADGSFVSSNMQLTAEQLTGLQIRLTPDNTASEGLRFKYTVIDDEGSVTTSIVDFRVTPVNDAPVIAAGQFNYRDGEASEVALADLVTDVDTERAQLKAGLTLADGSPLPDWISMDASWNVQLTPPENTGSDLQLRLTITDTNNVSTSQIITFSPTGDLIYGTDAADTLTGHTGGDNIQAGDGADQVYAKAGDDSIQAGAGNDTVWAGGGNDWIHIDSWDSTSDDKLYGEAGADILYDGAGSSTLDGGTGSDYMAGGDGSDFYIVDNEGDVVVDYPYDLDDRDRVESSVTFSALENGIEDIVLTGSVNTDATGNNSDNTLTGNSGNNVLNGVLGSDTMTGGLGNDEYYVHDAGDVVTELAGQGDDSVTAYVSWSLEGSQVEHLRLEGYDDINATGNGGANVLTGNWGNNILDGRAGSDTLTGGNGDDTYVVDVASDSIIEGAGIDTVISSTHWLLAGDLENLQLSGSAAINGFGNAGNNQLTGNGGNNVLDGKAGGDSMWGGAGNDLFVVDNGGDVVHENAAEGQDSVNSAISYGLSSNVEVLQLLGSAHLDGMGNTLNNTLLGNSGNNRLDGGAGADSMSGGLGNDEYTIDAAGDVVTEAASAGTDRVYSSVSHVLGANVENLSLTGNGAINGGGNELNNSLEGNSAANRLSGGAGNDSLDGGLGHDSLDGGAGNDAYVVDSVGDVVYESVAGGVDSVYSTVSWTLGAELEHLTLSGSSAINGTGNGLANLIHGNGGNNVLDGRAGSDSLHGGLGNDRYYVDSVGDIVSENAAAGTDAVFSSLSWTLSQHVENLTLTGSAAINGIGNTLNNVLQGNGGNNSLQGGSGNDSLLGAGGSDTLKGGIGNDVYVVDSGDSITEELNAGVDIVASSVSWTLGYQLEHLYMQGSAAINGTGNDLNNWLNGNNANNSLSGLSGNDSLIGGAGHDSLVGGSGSDTMRGGLGNDLYSVDALTDVISEAAGEGTDSVQSSVSYTLGNTLEHLTLTGSSALDGTGNSAANRLLGNAAINRLTGGAGNDTLDGGAGNDSLYGGSGNDRYQFGRGDGADRISENDTVSGNSDIAVFDAGISTSQLWLRRVGNDLELSIIGTSDRLTVGGWYLGSAYRVEKFQTADGQVLLAADVAKLVNAMASLTPPAAGQTTLPASYQTELNPVIAANWN